jgi:CubicO group peptidase (beta-lactamase class C family)
MSVLTDLPKRLKSAIRKYNVPGATIGVLHNGRITEAAAGVVNMDTGVPTTTDSVFQIGSITKVFTTTLIMQLQEQGRLDIDEPLRTYLPNFRVADMNVANTVTLRQLLCHTGGMDGDFFADAGRGDDCTARFVDMCAMLPQLFPPGQMMSYCNAGFAFLGRVIEVLTSSSFDDALRTNLFKPLGMRHAASLPEDYLRYRTAIGHLPNPKKPNEQRVTPTLYLSHAQKAAGATPAMSVGDLLAFTHAHLNGGVGKNGSKILNKSSVNAMLRRQIKLPRHAPSAISHWGLGWMLFDWNGRRIHGHDGGTIGQYSFLRILPEKNLAVALLTNGGDAGGLYEELFGELFRTLGKVRPPGRPEPNPGARVDRNRFVGAFENMTTRIEISRDTNGALRASQMDKIGTVGAAEFKGVPLAVVDANTLRLATGNPIPDRTVACFSRIENGRANFVSVRFRQFRRTDQG